MPADAAAWNGSSGVDRLRAGRPADRDLHLRLDRQSQGRDAQPRQRRLEHRGDRPDGAADAPTTWRSACCRSFIPTAITAALWTVLALDPKGVYHFNPLDAQQVGKLCREHRVTVFMATPTFLRTYLKRCAAGGFAPAGRGVRRGRKAARRTCSTRSKQKFGIRPLEAYGCTELVAAGVGQHSAQPQPARRQTGMREGTVGRPIPGVTVESRRSGELRRPKFAARSAGHAAGQRARTSCRAISTSRN